MPELAPDYPGRIIVDSFLPSQERTPLSAGSAVYTAIKLVEGGVDLGKIADADLDNDPDLFEYAVDETLHAHEVAGVTHLTTEEAVRERLPGAFRINMAVALGAIISAATGQEFDDDIRKIAADDRRLKDAEEALETEEGRARTLGVLAIIKEALAREEDSSQRNTLVADYQAAQRGQFSGRFPKGTVGGLPNRESQRRRLMGLLSGRLAELALTPDIGPAVRSLLRDPPDPVSLKLGP